MNGKIAIICLLVLILLTGCAGTLNNLQQWRQRRFEESAYREAIYILNTYLPKYQLEQCAYNFKAPRAKTIASTEEDLKEIAGWEIAGLYNKDTLTVYYIRNQYTTLIHEYIHYLNDISNVSRTCLDEVSAYMSVSTYEQAQKAKKWKRAYRREHSKNRNRR